MKRINVTGTYSFEEVLLIANEAINRAEERELEEVGVGELIDIVNHLAEVEDSKGAGGAKRKRGRPKGSANKPKAKAEPEGKKAEEGKPQAEREPADTMGASSPADDDEFAGI